jgi:hypothetical protein
MQIARQTTGNGLVLQLSGITRLFWTAVEPRQRSAMQHSGLPSEA